MNSANARHPWDRPRIIALGVSGASWLLAIGLSFHESEHAQVLGRYSWKYFAVLSGAWGLALALSVTDAEKWLERAYAKRFQLTLLLISLGVTFGVLEALIRITDPLGISYYEEAARYQFDKVADPDLIFRHPRSWQSRYQGADVRYNEMGLRDDPIGPKSKGEYRILFLGDSVPFGWGVAQDQIFTARLQRLLAAKSEHLIRVINTGVGGYDTVQEVTYFKSVGLALKPDMVALLYVSNDVEINTGPFDPWSSRSFRNKTLPEILNLLLGKSWLYRLVAHVSRYHSGEATEFNSFQMVRGSEGWTASMKSLRDLAETCKNAEIPLVMFYFRWKATPYNNALLEDLRAAVAPIPVQDMGEWFAGRDLQRYLNSKVDIHPNSAGHKVIAENLAVQLSAMKLIPHSVSRVQPGSDS